MDSEVALTPKAGELAEKAVRLLADAESLTISTTEEYRFAGSLIPHIGTLLAAFRSERMNQTRPLDAAKKAIMDRYASAQEPAENAERIIKKAMLKFRREEEARVREEQRIAEEKAEKERQRLEKLADRAEDRGDIEKAQAFEQRAATVVAPVAVSDAPKVEGTAIRKVWKFEVEDASLLPRNFLIPDESAIGAVVRALKDRHNIPGVRAWAEETIGRTGR